MKTFKPLSHSVTSQDHPVLAGCLSLMEDTEVLPKLLADSKSEAKLQRRVSLGPTDLKLSKAPSPSASSSLQHSCQDNMPIRKTDTSRTNRPSRQGVGSGQLENHLKWVNRLMKKSDSQADNTGAFFSYALGQSQNSSCKCQWKGGWEIHQDPNP